MKTGYTSLPTEHSYSFSAAEVEGAVPTDLRGVLFRNGPGLMERGGVKLDQPFDGDGMVCRFTFRDGSVSFQNRFVRTKGYQEEAVENKWIYRGAFATGNPSGGIFFNPFDFSVKNVANTHVLRWGRRLWALWEGGLPHELDSESLETLGGGASNWDGGCARACAPSEAARRTAAAAVIRIFVFNPSSFNSCSCGNTSALAVS